MGICFRIWCNLILWSNSIDTWQYYRQINDLNVLEFDITWFYDLTVLIHDSIIDKVMTCKIMAKGVAHSEGESLHKIPPPIIIFIICIEDYLLLK